MEKIVIAGGSGLVGRAASAYFQEKGFEIVIVSRSGGNSSTHTYIMWKEDELEKGINGAKAVINLAGASLSGRRWSDNYKNIIRNSRTEATEKLVRAMNKVENPPDVFINASAIGYYGYSDTKIFNELSPAGEGFLPDVCMEWEESASSAKERARLVICRIGVVLDRGGGALAKMLPAYRMFVGGPIGSGRQWISWIHIDDLISIFDYIIYNDISGPVNCVSPNVKTMRDFSNIIGKTLSRPAVFKAPEFVLKIIMGEASEIVLRGARVEPKVINECDFKFKYLFLEQAIEHLLEKE